MKELRIVFVIVMAVIVLAACGDRSSVSDRPPARKPSATSAPPSPTSPRIGSQITMAPPDGVASPDSGVTDTAEEPISIGAPEQVAKLTPFPTPTPRPGEIPSGDYFYIEYAEMASCEETRARCGYSRANPDPDPVHPVLTPGDICILWVEEGRREKGDRVKVEIFRDNRLVAIGEWPMVGNRICRAREIFLKTAGEYETILTYSIYELHRKWSIE